jgi:hypothetical protein
MKIWHVLVAAVVAAAAWVWWKARGNADPNKSLVDRLLTTARDALPPALRNGTPTNADGTPAPEARGGNAGDLPYTPAVAKLPVFTLPAMRLPSPKATSAPSLSPPPVNYIPPKRGGGPMS